MMKKRGNQTISRVVFCSLVLALFSSLFISMAHAAKSSQGIIKDVRMWAAPDSSRVVFDINRKLKHRLFVLHNPERVVLDIYDTRLNKSLRHLDISNSLIKKVRHAPRNRKNLRIVFDMNTRVQPKSFSLSPNNKYGHRLVVDLHEKNRVKKPARDVSPKGKLNRLRDVVIAIDAGHGGEDPGALGYGGTYEKEIVLDIARRLEKMVKRESGMRPLMIRKGDYFVSLNNRKKIARKHKADMFVSIHADSFRNKKVKGASVFALSSKGASSEAARILAENENATDIIGGVDFNENDSLLTSVLLDLTQTGTIETSLNLGNKVLAELKKVTYIHKPHVERARFVVLQSLGIPSILVETGFISNRMEEKKLNNWRYQQSVASSIMKGIKKYFRDQSPPGTFFARREAGDRVVSDARATGKYVIRRGDSLSVIASTYNVSMDQIRKLNPRISDRIRIGQVIRLPN